MPIDLLHFREVRVDQDNWVNGLIEYVERKKPILVVFDALLRIHRRNEDKSSEMAIVMYGLRKITNAGTTVLALHHHTKSTERPIEQRTRGTGDIPGGADVEYALTKRDDYLIFQSVKTRIRKIDPIRLRMEIENDRVASITYHGLEVGERGEVLEEVVNILGEKTKAGVKEIHEALKDRDLEVGINTLRNILKSAVGKELREERGDRGKKVYQVNSASQFNGYI